MSDSKGSPLVSTIRIVIVIRSFNLGGAERQAVHLANWIHLSGDFHVEVVAFEAGSAVPSLLAPGIPVKILHPGKTGLFSRFLGAIRFTRGLRNTRADIFIPFTDWPNKAVGAVWPLTGAKACIWNQRDEGREVTGRFLERRALKQASSFVANSKSGVDFLSAHMGVEPTRISAIPNCVVPLKPQQSREQWREQLSIVPQAFVVTMVASLSRFKDHPTLLQAWPLARKASPGSMLLLAGRDGDRGPRIRELASELEGVHLLGEVDDVGGLLAASDVLAHSSFREGTPNAILEAMAAGLPVVATDIPGTRAALGPDCRWLIPARDAPALARAIEDLARDQQLRSHTGKQNRERALQEFSPSKVSKAWLDVIQPLLQGENPKPFGTHGQKGH